MIKIYIHDTEINDEYIVMVVDHDLPLYGDKIHSSVLEDTIKFLKNEFSDTGREIKIFNGK